MTLNNLDEKIQRTILIDPQEFLCRRLDCVVTMASGDTIFFLESENGSTEDYCSKSCLLRDHRSASGSYAKNCREKCVLGIGSK